MPIAPSGVAPLVRLVSRDAQLSQIGHLRSGLLPLLPDPVSVGVTDS